MAPDYSMSHADYRSGGGLTPFYWLGGCHTRPTFGGVKMINCVFADRVSADITECRNSDKSHIKQAAQAYCYRCKHRIPVNKSEPAIVERLPKERQMRIEEWLSI